MRHPHPPEQPGLSAARLVLLTALFALVYTQSPVYSKNQNTYLLHGLADAGYGNLAADWLTSTADATPLFSALVAWSWRWTGLDEIFYLHHILLMGIYLHGVLGIVATVRDAPGVPRGLVLSRTAGWVFLVLLFTAHSAAFRWVMERLLGDNWLEYGVAGQYILGPSFQPSAFGVLLVTSIHMFMKGRPYLAVLCAALAASFHPTYLLPAALLTLAFVAVRLRQVINAGSPGGGVRRHLLPGTVQACLPGLISLSALLPILIYTYLHFVGAPGDVAERARTVLVESRIPSHASLDAWFGPGAVFKTLWVALALAVVRRTDLFLVLAIPFASALLLTVAQWVTGSTALALLFPWRISVVLVPLSTAVLLAWSVGWVDARVGPFGSSRRVVGALRSAVIGLFIALGLAGALRLALVFERRALSDERRLYAYVASHRAADDRYLIPTGMQDFRLATGAPAFVDHKSHPYASAEVLEWHQRLAQATGFYHQKSCNRLPEWVVAGGITHIVLPVGYPVCPGLHLLHLDPSCRVYRVGSVGAAHDAAGPARVAHVDPVTSPTARPLWWSRLRGAMRDGPGPCGAPPRPQ